MFFVLLFSTWAAIFGAGAFAGPASAGEPAVPNTLGGAFAALDELLSPEDRAMFKNTPEQQAVGQAHMGVGLYIRNTWFRHGGSKLPGWLHKLGARHMDDMSGIVLRSYWRWLNGKPLKVEEQIACYARWWDEQERLTAEAKAKGEDGYSAPSFHCP